MNASNNRDYFQLALIVALIVGLHLRCDQAVEAHHISAKKRGEPCVNGSCSMCRHNAAHARGLEHDKDGWYESRTRQRRPATPELAGPEKGQTPYVVVDAILAVIKPTPDDVLIDPGCGDGRFLVAAARDYGCRAVGIEIDRRTAEQAQSSAYFSGHESLVVVCVGDARRDPLLGVATVVVMYLYPDLIEELWPKFKSARVVASYQHRLPVDDQVRYEFGDHVFYVWTRP